MKEKIKEYEVLKIKCTWEDTQDMLNEYAEEGWILICSYANGNWLIMERDKEVEICKCCGGKK